MAQGGNGWVNDLHQRVEAAGGSMPVSTGPNNERRDAQGNLIGFTIPADPKQMTPEQRAFVTRKVRNELSAKWWHQQGEAQRQAAV